MTVTTVRTFQGRNTPGVRRLFIASLKSVERQTYSMTARKRHTVRQFTNGAKREISLFRHRKVSTATSFYLTGTVMV